MISSWSFTRSRFSFLRLSCFKTPSSSLVMCWNVLAPEARNKRRITRIISVLIVAIAIEESLHFVSTLWQLIVTFWLVYCITLLYLKTLSAGWTNTNRVITAGHNVPIYSCLQLPQMLTDFQAFSLPDLTEDTYNKAIRKCTKDSLIDLYTEQTHI